MYQQQFDQRGPWYRSNIKMAGIAIAGQCVLVLVFFGFGLLLMGTILMAVSSGFGTKSNFGPTTNVPRVIGAVFLSIGSVIFVFGMIFLIYAVRKFNFEVQQPANQIANVTVSGATYPASQPYQTGPAQPYTNPRPTYQNSGPLISGTTGSRTQQNPDPKYSYPGGQTQPYPTALSGQPSYNPSHTAGQPPVGPGQPSYNPSHTAGQPPVGPGQPSYNPSHTANQPPVGPGQPYSNAPVGQPQQYQGKTYNVPSNPYNAEQSCPYPTGYGQPPHMVPPPPYYDGKM